MRFNARYPATFLVERRNAVGMQELSTAFEVCTPFWNDPNAVAFRQMLVVVGSELELFCKRGRFDMHLISSVALGIMEAKTLGGREANRFREAVEELRSRREDADRENSSARVVYERMYGDRDNDGITEFHRREGGS